MFGAGAPGSADGMGLCLSSDLWHLLRCVTGNSEGIKPHKQELLHSLFVGEHQGPQNLFIPVPKSCMAVASSLPKEQKTEMEGLYLT